MISEQPRPVRAIATPPLLAVMYAARSSNRVPLTRSSPKRGTRMPMPWPGPPINLRHSARMSPRPPARHDPPENPRPCPRAAAFLHPPQVRVVRPECSTKEMELWYAATDGLARGRASGYCLPDGEGLVRPIVPVSPSGRLRSPRVQVSKGADKPVKTGSHEC